MSNKICIGKVRSFFEHVLYEYYVLKPLYDNYQNNSFLSGQRVIKKVCAPFIQIRKDKQ